MATEYEIHRVLVLSTGHMTREDNKQLQFEPLDFPLISYELGEYGYLVVVPLVVDSVDELEQLACEGRFSDAFIQVLRKARELGCGWVRFDRDAEHHDELQQFAW